MPTQNLSGGPSVCGEPQKGKKEAESVGAGISAVKKGEIETHKVNSGGDDLGRPSVESEQLIGQIDDLANQRVEMVASGMNPGRWAGERRRHRHTFQPSM
jgi:hypothetical protein